MVTKRIWLEMMINSSQVCYEGDSWAFCLTLMIILCIKQSFFCNCFFRFLQNKIRLIVFLILRAVKKDFERFVKPIMFMISRKYMYALYIQCYFQSVIILQIFVFLLSRSHSFLFPYKFVYLQ